MKIYYLEIGYNEDTEEIEYISEEVEGDVNTFNIDGVDMKQYWDEDYIKLSKDMIDIGVA